jgi:outer membrane protein assembly factor BamB
VLSRLRAIGCLVVFAALHPVTPAAGADRAASDWPQFRGPNRDDHSPDTGLLKEWPKEGPPLVWKTASVGTGYSSVTLAGGRLFTMGNKGPSSFVVALDAESGKPLWSQEVGKAGGDLGCTPTVAGDLVYALGQSGDLVCLAADTGAVQWRKNLEKDFGGKWGGWHYTESPLVDGDQLVCTPGGKDATMVALNSKSGETVWKCAIPIGENTAGYSSIVVAEVGGVPQYVQLLSGGVVGVAAKDGKFLWKYEKLGHNTANIPTPIVLGDHVLCAAGYGKGGALLQLVPTATGVEAKELYFKPGLTNKHGGLVVVGEYVYGDSDDSGRPFCAEVKTGQVVWRKEGGGPGEGSASVVYADEHLYFRYDNGVTALVEASPKGYKEVSTFAIPKHQGPSWAHPVVIGGRLYLREGDTVWCYNVKQA